MLPCRWPLLRQSRGGLYEWRGRNLLDHREKFGKLRQEQEKIQFLAQRAIRGNSWRIRERPLDFGRSVLARLGHFWSVAPVASVYSRGVRWATMAWTLPLWLAVLLALPRRDLWYWPRIVAPLSAIGLTLVHGFFWTDMRMRAPIVPAIALIAAGAALPQFITKRSTSTVSDQTLDV